MVSPVAYSLSVPGLEVAATDETVGVVLSLGVGHGREDERRQGDEEEGEEPGQRMTESGIRITGHAA